MTKAKISEYDAVAANNTDVNGVNIAENCPPSGMNNMGREIMAALKRFQVGSDGDGVTVGGNLVVSGTSTVAALNTSGAVVFNDAGADVDFRVEGDTEANLLFVDASTDRVGIGTNAPVSALNVIASVDKVAVIGAASNLDSDADVLWGAGIKETQLLNGTASRPGVLSIGGSLTANESIGIINFFRSGNTDGYRSRAYIRGATTGSGTAEQHGGILMFATAADNAGNPTERARITSGGDLYVGTTSGLVGTSDFGAIIAQSGGIFGSRNEDGGVVVFYTGGNQGAFRVLGDGDAQNTNNSYGAISDIKTKQDVVDAASQWDDIKNIRVRKFRFQNNPTGPLQIGVVAQELEEVSPGLVDEHPDYEEVEVPILDDEGNAVLNEDGTPQVTTEQRATDTTTKSVKYSILYMKAVKALQEAMERIETLEASNTALEARIAALETGV